MTVSVNTQGDSIIRVGEYPGPVVTLINGEAYASSLDIARFFNKPHKSVLLVIDQILEEYDEHITGNFVRTSIPIHRVGRGVAHYPAYYVKEDSFDVLVLLCFSGKKAQKSFIDYMDKFDEAREIFARTLIYGHILSCFDESEATPH